MRYQLLTIVFLLVFPLSAFAQPEPEETIRVDSDLVDLRVSVLNLNSQNPGLTLQQRDFLVLEDGKPQDIEFFAAAETPFDLILLLDLSGSTKDKLKLIRKSAKRFVETTRANDRVSVVGFSSMARLVCPLTQDRELLKKSIDRITEPEGGTNFWDSLRTVLAILNASKNSARRHAVVVMTDGVDNALPDVLGDGSQTTFEELDKIVRSSDALVYPIYLNTEKETVKRFHIMKPAFAMAQQQLAEIAVASGTRLYRAERLEDLDDVYQQVIGDLGHVYSIGYRPTNKTRDGKWRAVSVKVVDRQDVLARTKEGYYSAN
jgi:VWFA-related protein